MSLIIRVSDKEKLSDGSTRMKLTVTSASGKIPGNKELAMLRAKCRALAEAGIVSEASREHLSLARDRVQLVNEESEGEFAKMFAEEMVFTMKVK